MTKSSLLVAGGRPYLAGANTSTTATTKSLVSALAKQWHWRATVSGTANGTHDTTHLQVSDDLTLTVNAYKGYRLTKVAPDGTAESSEITANSDTTFTVSPAFASAPVDGDTFTVTPPCGYRPVITGYVITVHGAASASTLKLESVNTVGTTTVETFDIPQAGTPDVPVVIAISGVEKLGVNHGNLQYTTSAAMNAAVEVEGYWMKDLWRCS